MTGYVDSTLMVLFIVGVHPGSRARRGPHCQDAAG